MNFVFSRLYLVFMKFEKIKVGEGDNIVIPIAECYRDCMELIRSDLYRYRGIRFSAFRVVAHVLAHPFSL